MTILRGDDIKWRIRAISGSRGLKIFPSQNGSRVTLPVREVGLALAILSSEKLMVKERPENGVFGTFRCRQIGRRGLNRKTVMIDRSHVPNYPPVQIFSEKYDKLSEGALWDFFVPIQSTPKSVDTTSVDKYTKCLRVFDD